MNFWWFWTSPPVVEEALDEDLPKLAEIHGLSFPHQWDEDELSRLNGQDGVMILEARRASPYGTRNPLGFIIIRTVAGEAEVLTIAVHPRSRGRGVGKKLMQEAIFRLYSDRCECLFLEVDSANDPAVLLYKSLGFRQIGERKGYYRNGKGNGTALVMRVDLR